MIFALALASNSNAQANLAWALKALDKYGNLTISKVFKIPCRDGIGADYLNCACLLHTAQISLDDLALLLKQLEETSGRIRPSHQISLDIDLIAWKGSDVSDIDWKFNKKKMPFALDVKIPLYELIQHPTLMFHDEVAYQTIKLFPQKSSSMI